MLRRRVMGQRQADGVKKGRVKTQTSGLKMQPREGSLRSFALNRKAFQRHGGP